MQTKLPIIYLKLLSGAREVEGLGYIPQQIKHIKQNKCGLKNVQCFLKKYGLVYSWSLIPKAVQFQEDQKTAHISGR